MAVRLLSLVEVLTGFVTSTFGMLMFSVRRDTNVSGDEMRSALRRFVADESGQDLIEYALLATFMAIVTVIGIQLLGTAMGESYTSWDEASQGIYEPPDPVPSGP